ncbi:hypothetical protein FGG08_007452 [Glutinoglossum americanum]|uniref:ORP1 like protein n=1 Tax=Glutinoglossum americanum TaxID=1670608 RepID=A0A9P8HU65_9PEZI|nr:hypothetical protein FGG08_007452 [Glutinoglossum americanum]
MDIKTLLNPPMEDGGYGVVNDGESMAWSHHTKAERQLYRYGAEELGRRPANDLYHRRARDATSASQGSHHFRPSYHGEVIDRDGDESPYASTHKSSISRSSFSSFTSSCPSASGTSSSLYPEQDRSFPSPPLPPHARLQSSRATLSAEERHRSSVDAAGFTMTSSYMARSPPYTTSRASPSTTNLHESTYPLVAPSQSESSNSSYNRYFPSPAMTSPESTLAALVSIATADRRGVDHYKGLKWTQGRQDCGSAHVSSIKSEVQNHADSQEPQRQQSIDASGGAASLSTHSLNTRHYLEITNDAKDDPASDRAEKSGSSTPRFVALNSGQGQYLNRKTSQAESISSVSSTPPRSSRGRAKPRRKSPSATKPDRKHSEPRSANETERPALASLSPMPSSHSGGSPAGRPLEHTASTAISPGVHGPKCSYTENCTTGSPLRKVVSHIFGRNKLCTRQIPKSVWVHYCRKHYQRSRYRNPRGFALLQCDLVRKQVDRLQIWGGVTDWVIKVRKREELRLSKEKAERESGVFVRSNDKNVTVDAEDQAPSKNRKRGSTGSGESTKWLLDLTGSEKTTADVLHVLERIEKDIADTGASFPDVEILPNVGQATKTRSSGMVSPRKNTRSRIGSQSVHDPHSGAIYPDSSSGEASSDSGSENVTVNAVDGPTAQAALKRKRKHSEDVSLRRDGLPEAKDHDEQRPATKRRRSRTDL